MSSCLLLLCPVGMWCLGGPACPLANLCNLMYTCQAALIIGPATCHAAPAAALQLTWQLPHPALQALRLQGQAFVNGGNLVQISGE